MYYAGLQDLFTGLSNCSISHKISGWSWKKRAVSNEPWADLLIAEVVLNLSDNREAPDNIEEPKHNDAERNLILTRMQGMIDLPRPETIDAVRGRREAGIRVAMIPGDHAVTTMVLFQFFQAWNSRSELQSVFTISPLSNPFLFYSMVAAFLAQLAVVYVPALQWVFRTEALNGAEWGQIVLIALTVVVGVEVDKAIRRHKKRIRT
jgi:magnesium-transporting ATPase (P-type)